VDECKPLPTARAGHLLRQLHAARGAQGKGLTPVDFLAQPKPFWSHLPVSPRLIDWGEIMHSRYATKSAMLSRKVDE